MAAVPVMITGVLWDHAAKAGRAVTLMGEATIVGLEVGGGPIVPPSDGKPPGIWGGGNVPMPTPPIANVPGAPGWPPPGIWPDPGPLPHPEHPIVLPPQPIEPPENPSEPKPPPPGGGWGWSPEYGWGYFPGGGGKPQPIP